MFLFSTKRRRHSPIWWSPEAWTKFFQRHHLPQKFCQNNILKILGARKGNLQLYFIEFECINIDNLHCIGNIIENKKRCVNMNVFHNNSHLANISAMNDSGRIYRSILVLITVRLSGFFAMRIFRLYIAHGIWPFMTRWCISQTMSILLNMSTASTGPILYGTRSRGLKGLNIEILN